LNARSCDRAFFLMVVWLVAEPIDQFEITEHAVIEMRRRRIEESLVLEVLAVSEQRHTVRANRDVLQSRIVIGGKTYLLRVFVDIDRKPAEVVTVYLTSRVIKY
jgi:hypothetical protein